MFCSHCGKEVAAGAKFCANCGAAVNSQPTPAAEPPKAPPPTAQREVPTVEQVGTPIGNGTGNGGQPKKKKGVPKPLIIVAAVLVLFVGFGAVLSLSGGGSEPDSDSGEESEIISASSGDNGGNRDNSEDTVAPVVTPSPPEWIGEIPEQLGRFPSIGDISDNYNYLSLETHRTASYDELKNTIGPYFEYFGAPDNDEIQYYQNSTDFFGIINDQRIYELWVENQVDCQVASQHHPVHRPLIVKNDTGIYYLLYKLENCYVIYVTEPADPAAPYLTWDVLYEIRVANENYCDLLNGRQPLEKVGIPEEDFSLPEWVNDIPVVTGDSASWESIFSSEIKYEPHPPTSQSWPDGFTESDLFIYGVMETEYGMTYVVVEDSVESYLGSGYALIPRTRESVGNYRIVLEQEPLIGKDANLGTYYLFYKRDSGYEIYKVWANAPSYQDWSIDAIFYVTDPRCFTYMNGERNIEIISRPGQDVQQGGTNDVLY